MCACVFGNGNATECVCILEMTVRPSVQCKNTFRDTHTGEGDKKVYIFVPFFHPLYCVVIGGCAAALFDTTEEQR